MIRRFPNGKTHLNLLGYLHTKLFNLLSILICKRRLGELKHLSTPRKRNQRDSVSSGERKRKSPNPTDACIGWGL